MFCFLKIFAAIAVPISKEMKNVFVSYNFEANYNSPATSTDFTRPLEKVRKFCGKYSY